MEPKGEMATAAADSSACVNLNKRAMTTSQKDERKEKRNSE